MGHYKNTYVGAYICIKNTLKPKIVNKVKCTDGCFGAQSKFKYCPECGVEVKHYHEQDGFEEVPIYVPDELEPIVFPAPVERRGAAVVNPIWISNMRNSSWTLKHSEDQSVLNICAEEIEQCKLAASQSKATEYLQKHKIEYEVLFGVIEYYL